ncbi:uncharacterized protein LOC129768665 [Toxorhynchites rutilus septentrionalis]|uniref:uncharacterized protein LOC129768665 n=1 Tax=Toxorhynchites rutilus septentrionalis TaxID=329112 RepID=UPI00247974DB|nr:uncharacterized protein LOC129768665 [Toxorhynchites rutilus septentrionalis]
MKKIYVNLLITLSIFGSGLAYPHTRAKRSLFSYFFGGGSTEPPSTTTEPAVTDSPDDDQQLVYFVPKPNDPNVPPTFVPVVPVRYYTSPNGQNYIAVRPVMVQYPNTNVPYLPTYLPTNKISEVEKYKPNETQKKYSAESAFGLSPSEVSELNQLAKQLGVQDMHDLPPLEEVMTLLGTTNKSETIKAVRDYASTPGGLELIKEYVLSYQPVKRMDTFEKEKHDNEIEYNGKYAAGRSLNSEDYVVPNNQVPIIGYSQMHAFDKIESTKPVRETGFFAALRSFFSFGSTGADNTLDEIKEFKSSSIPSSGQIPMFGSKLIPHFIIPIGPLPDDLYTRNVSQRNTEGLPMSPSIQDMDPFLWKSPQIDATSTELPIESSTHSQPNVTESFQDNVGENELSDEVRQLPVRISLPDESIENIHTSNLNEVTVSPSGKVSVQIPEAAGEDTVSETTTVITTTVGGLHHTTENTIE